MSDFTPSMFPVEAERIFRQVQDGYALADVGALRGLVTEEVLSVRPSSRPTCNVP